MRRWKMRGKMDWGRKAWALVWALAVGMVMSSCNFFSESKFVPVQLKEDGKWNMLDLSSGRFVFIDEFEGEPTVASDDIFAVPDGDYCSLYKVGKTPEKLSTPQLTGAGLCSEGLIPVAVDKQRLQVLNDKGEKQFELSPVGGREIIACAPDYSDGWLKVELDDNSVTFIDTKGNPMGQEFIESGTFQNGYCIVHESATGKSAEETPYMVIDKKGETVLKLKIGDMPVSETVENDKLLVKTPENKFCVMNLKGETSMLTQEADMYMDFLQYGEIAFLRNELFGVMTEDGKILVNPKYSNLYIMSEDRFLAQQPEGGWVILNRKGEEIFSTNKYEDMYAEDGYLFGKGDKTYNVLDENGKLICETDFYGLGLSQQCGTLESNYFDCAKTASTIVKTVESTLTEFKIGENAVQVMSNAKSDYPLDQNFFNMEESTVRGAHWFLMTRLEFSQDLGKSDSESDVLRLSDTSILVKEVFGIISEFKDGNQELFNALQKAFETAGYKAVAATENQNSDNAVNLTNGTYNLRLESFSRGEMYIFATKVGMTQQLPDENFMQGGAMDESSTDDTPGNASTRNAGTDYAWLSQREVTLNDISGMDKVQLRILRNAIYALHGYKFKTADMTDYFSQFSWYTPRYNDVTSQLSAIEKKNIEFIKKHE